MTESLPGETDAQYTDRLTGADKTGRRPYAEHRLRQCSIGYHDECSDPTGEICECPCHKLTSELWEAALRELLAYAAEQQALKEKAEAVAAENAEHFLARIAELEALYQRQVKKHADDFDELSQGYLARAEKAEARADALDDELELLVARAEKAEADSQHLCGKLNSALARVAGLEGEVARLKDLEKARWVKVPLFMKIRHCAKCDSYHALDADCPPPMILRGPEVR